MSEVIVRMEIPKDCPMCPMAHYNKLDEFTGCEVAYGKRYAVKTDKAYAESACRPDWCPIKGKLPEQHGDLIDRDEVKQKMIHYGFSAIDMTATEFCEDELQTVIAAERSET